MEIAIEAERALSELTERRTDSLRIVSMLSRAAVS